MTKTEDNFKLPAQGFVFWPVGTGDSTTVTVNPETPLQIDLHHLASSNDDDDPHAPIVDRLKKLLPIRDGEPYLATFVLTHPDEDHCLGFADLLKEVSIGELWFSPRIFREYKKDLCDDAKAFQTEAKRRVKKTIAKKGDAGSGDRVRIIGYDDLLEKEEFKGFPRDRLTVPGNAITDLDGADHATAFRAFVHAPFKDDATGDRNDCSIALQIRLIDDPGFGSALFLGDHCYPTIKRIFDRSAAADLEWNVMLAAHHCSKSAMYWKDDGDDDEVLKQDILDAMEEAELNPGYIVASSEPIPASNKKGDNPPHAKAKQRYEEITNDDFLCTQEHPDEENPQPIVFEMSTAGLQYRECGGSTAMASSISMSAAIVAARGTDEPPRERVGFGQSHD